ncbi:MAG: TIGR00282 family metallophosphoesterase [Candidatus Poribacteria bacterium]
MKILFIGDIIGQPGRSAVIANISRLKAQYQVNLTIANGENLAGGMGITPETANELLSNGIDVISTGNHVWDKKEIVDYIDKDDRIIRPANYPQGVPGKGWTFKDVDYNQDKLTIAVLNLSGCVFMQPLDNPFRVSENILPSICEKTNIIIVDFHAEATSEKIALGRFLDGKVSAVIGTHTHVQTADETIFPSGTAYITDVGMTGPINSIIGTKTDLIIKRFLTQMPTKFEVPKGEVCISAVVIEIDPFTGKSLSIKRIYEIV